MALYTVLYGSNGYAKTYEDIYDGLLANGQFDDLASTIKPLVSHRSALLSAVDLHAPQTQTDLRDSLTIVMADTKGTLGPATLCATALCLLRCGAAPKDISAAFANVSSGRLSVNWDGAAPAPDDIGGVSVVAAHSDGSEAEITLRVDTLAANDISTDIAPGDVVVDDAAGSASGHATHARRFNMWRAVKSHFNWISKALLSIARGIVRFATAIVASGYTSRDPWGSAFGTLAFAVRPNADDAAGRFAVAVGGSNTCENDALSFGVTFGAWHGLFEHTWGFGPLCTSQLVAETGKDDGGVAVGPLPRKGKPQWPRPRAQHGGYATA
ncbi:MAG: hypothetical protein AB3N09_03825 [Tateyamaria sp.]